MSRKTPQELTPEVAAMVDKALVDRYEAARALPVAQVARLFGVSTKTVRRLIDAGEVPHVRVGGRLVVQQADAIAYLSRNRHGAAETA